MELPHQRQPVYHFGAPLPQARLGVILLHDAGSTAEAILRLGRMLPPVEAAYLAPQAEAGFWYPYDTLAPLEDNQPHLDAALEALARLLARLQAAAALPRERLLLGGFGQGASLAAEFILRNPRACGGLALLSGAIPGSAAQIHRHTVRLHGVQVFAGYGESDFHLPVRRMRESIRILRSLGATVRLQTYPHMGHLINNDEIRQVARLLHDLLQTRRNTAA